MKAETKSFLKSLVIDIIIVAVIVLAVSIFIKPVIVKKTSMYPNLQDGNYVLVYKQAYNFGEPKYGQVVVFPTQTASGEELYIKRVIGLPGDTIDIKDNKVYVNGVEKNQDYTADGITPGSVSNFVVPEGELYVMGDNRVVSIDSRYTSVGTVKIDDVTGVAVFRIWPFSEFGKIAVEE